LARIPTLCDLMNDTSGTPRHRHRLVNRALTLPLKRPPLGKPPG